MGIPVSARNIFPSNIQGCPPGTTYGSTQPDLWAGRNVAIS
jgi:hypothetical protein